MASSLFHDPDDVADRDDSPCSTRTHTPPRQSRSSAANRPGASASIRLHGLVSTVTSTVTAEPSDSRAPGTCGRSIPSTSMLHRRSHHGSASPSSAVAASQSPRSISVTCRLPDEPGCRSPRQSPAMPAATLISARSITSIGPLRRPWRASPAITPSLLLNRSSPQRALASPGGGEMPTLAGMTASRIR